jgi:small-conductance mechanosensitive channel
MNRDGLPVQGKVGRRYMLRAIVLAFMFFGAAASNSYPLSAPDESKPAASEKTKMPAGQVVLDGKSLFVITERAVSFPPADRARLISERIARLVKDPLFHTGSITTVNTDVTTDIVSGETVIMSITDKDSEAAGKTKEALAKEFAGKIRAAIEIHNREYSMRSILFGGIYAFIATLFLVALFIISKFLFPKITGKIESWRGTRIRSIKIQSVEILHEDRIVELLIKTVKWLRILFFLAFFSFYFLIVFSLFPWTRGLSAKLYDYIAAPVEKIGHGILSYLPNLFYIAIIIIFTHLAIRITRFFFLEIEKRTITLPGFFPEWAMPTFKILRFLAIAFALVVAFPYLPGSESPAFRGVTIFLGVLLSLGSTSAVANIVAGFILTYMRALNLGDRVKIADTIGDVVEKNLLITRIRTIKNVDITIPNTMVLGSHIINYSSSAKDYGLILHTSVTIGYDAPWRKVHELLIAAALSTENIVELPAPFVLQTSLDDFYVTYELNTYTEKPSMMARTYSELHQNIQDKFNEAGLEIMSSHYSQLRDGNHTTIPEDYLPSSYRAPAIRVRNVAPESEIQRN